MLGAAGRPSLARAAWVLLVPTQWAMPKPGGFRTNRLCRRMLLSATWLSVARPRPSWAEPPRPSENSNRAAAPRYRLRRDVNGRTSRPVVRAVSAPCQCRAARSVLQRAAPVWTQQRRGVPVPRGPVSATSSQPWPPPWREPSSSCTLRPALCF